MKVDNAELLIKQTIMFHWLILTASIFVTDWQNIFVGYASLTLNTETFF